MNNETLKSLRYCFQRILVPCAVLIGILGNSVSVLVLTRKRMRSSTNIYLTALAIADISYLFMVFTLSFQHYQSIHHPRFELYWRTYGLQHWLCDASSYISIYITVSFTIERYIAVCHPIRGQVLCTESKAKKVISVVTILCLLCTCTTAFEYQLSYTPNYLDKRTDEVCTPHHVTNTSTGLQVPIVNCTLPWDPSLKVSLQSPTESTTPTTTTTTLAGTTSTSTSSTGENSKGSTHQYDNDYSYYQNDEISEDYKVSFGLEDEDTPNTISTPSSIELPTEILNATTIGSTTAPEDYCHCMYLLEAKRSALGNDHTYLLFFMWSTSVVFTFIPLILLITFNSFLVLAVKKSNKLRIEMTNVNSRKIKHKISSISQENKITVTLIAVVILFIICQTPTAIYIIVTEASSPDELPEEIKNVHFAMGNIFNFLITFNAACNFLLYCALSNKYRQTVKELIMGRKYMRQPTLKSFYFHRHGTIGDSWYNNRFSSSHVKPSIDLSTQSTRKSSTKSIERIQEGRNSFHHEPIPEHRPSVISVPADSRKNSEALDSVVINRLLKPSDSSSSLTRSQSVILKPKTRHSPHCKEFSNNL